MLNLGLEGTVSLSTAAEIDAVVEEFRPVFAAIERRESDTDLVVVPSENDFSGLGLAGFAAEGGRALAAVAAQPGGAGAEAADALRLLHRLARSGT